ncbi:C2H2 type zinc finger domain-containing protein [Dactylonectria macrodidyma]|uniref:C2H2 type zinc finger domain-containing protein n=1 Tax=Dactylonectria macrodidyma TaxID=307937 RepID=A0A9P9E950_9HYPO|nr:C2H2 type zinc finger domain-containing protein [Dactylonectria macrodidyma]
MTMAVQYQQSPQMRGYGDGFSDHHDPDEVAPCGSPFMTPLRPRLSPTPSPPPEFPQIQFGAISFDECDTSDPRNVPSNSGNAVLVTYLGGGRNPEIARVAALQSLPCVAEVPDESDLDGPVGEVSKTVPSLQHLAAGALQVTCATGPTAASSSASIPALALQGTDAKLVIKPSSVAVLTNVSGTLPPLRMDLPRSRSCDQVLPSIRSTLGDLNRLSPKPMAERDLVSRHQPSHNSPSSPPGGIPRFPPIATTHASPPIPQDEGRTQNLPSSHSEQASTSANTTNQTGVREHSDADCISRITAETPSTDHSASTPATSTSVTDRKSIGSVTNPRVGAYICTFIGCTAPAFQTQYLLNSHTNVHSSARPHYCSVQGCPRSEGGKGFKRKNEMIRHGLVHDSPGYVCPFCPDREHKYPRPDNLQRHVRVHHVDKDKDDPLLRDVLSQRPDGPNRGRRRRGHPT